MPTSLAAQTRWGGTAGSHPHAAKEVHTGLEHLCLEGRLPQGLSRCRAPKGPRKHTEARWRSLLRGGLGEWNRGGPAINSGFALSREAVAHCTVAELACVGLKLAEVPKEPGLPRGRGAQHNVHSALDQKFRSGRHTVNLSSEHLPCFQPCSPSSLGSVLPDGCSQSRAKEQAVCGKGRGGRGTRVPGTKPPRGGTRTTRGSTGPGSARAGGSESTTSHSSWSLRLAAGKARDKTR